jgi:hypothetical protein
MPSFCLPRLLASRSWGPVKAVLLHLGWWGMRGKGGSGRVSSNKLGGVGSRADLESLSHFLRRHGDGRKGVDRSRSMLLGLLALREDGVQSFSCAPETGVGGGVHQWRQIAADAIHR